MQKRRSKDSLNAERPKRNAEKNRTPGCAWEISTPYGIIAAGTGPATSAFQP
jgi:hypothetical protein